MVILIVKIMMNQNYMVLWLIIVFYIWKANFLMIQMY